MNILMNGTEFESLKKYIQEHKHLNHCEKCLAQEYCERLIEGIKNIEEEYKGRVKTNECVN